MELPKKNQNHPPISSNQPVIKQQHKKKKKECTAAQEANHPLSNTRKCGEKKTKRNSTLTSTIKYRTTQLNLKNLSTCYCASIHIIEKSPGNIFLRTHLMLTLY